MKLPEPLTTGAMTLESALLQRRSVRSFTPEALAIADISQILWAAQGVTGFYGQRTAPSAGALYPLEIYLAAARVTGLQPGVYRYQPQDHSVMMSVEGDIRTGLSGAALHQRSLEMAPVSLVLAAVFDRTAWKYGQRAERYVFMEIGHVAQNISLQVVALGLGSVVIGAFDDELVKGLMHMESDEEPLCILPIGKGRGDDC